jgi:hypothetical protein
MSSPRRKRMDLVIEEVGAAFAWSSTHNPYL